MTQPINSGAPQPVQGVTGGPGLNNGSASIDPGTGNIVFTPPGNAVEIKKSPSAFNLYEYFNSNSDYTRLQLATAVGGPESVLVQSQPTSVVRDLRIGTLGGVWRFLGSNGAFRPETDNAFDIGDATHRVRNLFLAEQIATQIPYAKTALTTQSVPSGVLNKCNLHNVCK